MVTKENYEEYMMLDADGELDSVGKQALQEFLAANPALQEELATWHALKLQPEATLVYPDKDDLLKTEPKAIMLNLRPYVLAAAAAVLAAVILIPALWKHDDRKVQMAQNGNPVEAVPPVVNITRDSGYSDAIPTSSVNSKSRRKTTPNSAAPRIARSIAASDHAGVKALPTESVVLLNAASVRPLQEATAVSAPDLQPQHVAMAVAQEAPKQQASGFPRVTLAPENQAAFNQLKDAFEGRFAKASAAARTVKETALEIRLGKGSVNINF